MSIIEDVELYLFFFLAVATVLSFPVHLTVFGLQWIRAKHRLTRPPFASQWIVLHAFLTTIVLLGYIFFIFGIRGMNVKAKQSEAKTNLQAIYQAQQNYFSRTNTYAGGPHVFELIHWEPAGQNRYAYYCGAAAIENKLPLGREMPLPKRDWPVELRPQSSANGFICMALGNFDQDDTLDVWSINDAQVLSNVQKDMDIWLFH